MKLSSVSAYLDGTLLREGDFYKLAFATEQEQTGFLTFLEREKFLPALCENTGVSCVLCTPELADQIPERLGVFVCSQPKAALFQLHNGLAQEDQYTGAHFPTRCGRDCTISPLAVIPEQDVIIGDRVTIEPFAVLKGRVTIGDDVTIRSGSVIGCKGFSFSKDEQGRNVSVVDAAEIVLHSHAEIFENVCISTGIFPWEQTVIGENTKVDAQCHIGHGAHIGTNCLLAEGSRCCGNSRVGDHTWIGVGAVVSNRVRVGANSRVSIGAVATKDVPDGQTVTGNFAIDHARFMQHLKASADCTPVKNNCPPPPGRARVICAVSHSCTPRTYPERRCAA